MHRGIRQQDLKIFVRIAPPRVQNTRKEISPIIKIHELILVLPCFKIELRASFRSALRKDSQIFPKRRLFRLLRCAPRRDSPQNTNCNHEKLPCRRARQRLRYSSLITLCVSSHDSPRNNARAVQRKGIFDVSHGWLFANFADNLDDIEANKWRLAP